MNKILKYAMAAGALVFLAAAIFTTGQTAEIVAYLFGAAFCESLYTRAVFREQVQALHGAIIMLAGSHVALNNEVKMQ